MGCADLGRFNKKSAQCILVKIHCKSNENVIGALQLNGDSPLMGPPGLALLTQMGVLKVAFISTEGQQY